jgi:hypothetical protein
MRYLYSQCQQVLLADTAKPAPGTRKRRQQGQSILIISCLEGGPVRAWIITWLSTQERTD